MLVQRAFFLPLIAQSRVQTPHTVRQQSVGEAIAGVRSWAATPGDAPLPSGEGITIIRLPLYTPEGANAPDACIALEITETDGTYHLLIANAPHGVGELRLPIRQLILRGDACYLCRDFAGRLAYAALLHGILLQADGLTLTLHQPTDYYDIAWRNGERIVL